MKYRVFFRGREIPVQTTKVNPRPYNHTEIQEFVQIICPEGGGRLTVESEEPFDCPVVRPLSLGLDAVAGGTDRVYIDVPGPCNFSLESGGRIVGNLLVFLSPERDDHPSPGSPGVIYFGRGEHDVGTMYLSRDDVTVFLDEGAVLRGKMHLLGCRNVRICGAGRIDDERSSERAVTLDIAGCVNVEVRDIVVTNPTTWTVRPFASENVRIDNVKIIGCRGNSDGVDVVNSRHVLVENLFTRTWDDSLVVKAFGENDRRRDPKAPWTEEQYDRLWAMAGDVYDLTFRHCTLWNDFARPMEIGVELRADEVRDILFEDIDMIHSTTGYPVMGCHHGDRADVHDIVFRDIRIEDAPGAQLFDFRITDSVWSTDGRKGRIHDVTVRDVDLLPPAGDTVMPSMSRLEGWSAENSISDFRFENVRLMGRYAFSPETLGLSVRDHAYNVTVSCDKEGPRVRPVAGRLEVVSPFEPDENGRMSGVIRLTAVNTGTERADGQIRLAVSPANMTPEPKPLVYRLAPGGTASEEYALTLQPGRYLVCAAGGSPEVTGDWLLLTLEGRREGFKASFRNYYGDEPGEAYISVDGVVVTVRPELKEYCTGMTLYAADAPETAPNEVLFTCEETDFGECGAVIEGPHGPEPAPQLRCPAEITYVFKNEPRTGPIRRVDLPARGISEIPLRDIVSDSDGPLLLELTVRFPGSEKRRYPCALFHSVIPGECAHMFVRVPAKGKDTRDDERIRCVKI